MKKLIFCISLVCMGMLSSCVDKNELVDEDEMPTWLGSSIYGELSNPDPDKGLTGSFKTYLRLVDDLNYAEILNRTGSKTVFPANDEAFGRFFSNNSWGVSKYEDLSQAQKRLLLYYSMLDNAILVEMLSNVSSDDGVVRGNAVKHPTTITAIDTVTTWTYGEAVSSYGEHNPFWTRFPNGISFVSDATNPMLVHFTRNYMLKNGITTSGDDSDFAIISGGQYQSANDAYVFGNRIIAQDVTCQNGYIHQVEDVIVPPGNMAQVLHTKVKNGDNVELFSHMLDRYAVPVYNADVTQQFHDWYAEQSLVNDMSGVFNPDSIYEVRYLSKSSKDAAKFSGDARNGGLFTDDYLLTFDPGWNEYYIPTLQSGAAASELAEIATMFVPTDEAVKDYLLNNERTKLLLETYAQLPNNEANLKRNIDFIPLNVLSKLISNLMNTSFSSSVPSKFNSVVDDAKDLMGITPVDLADKAGGGKDITIANNGVIYVTKKVFGPKAYEVVSAPALFNSSVEDVNTNMGLTNWIIQNVSYNNPFSLGLDYYAYLLSTTATYGIMLPNQVAFDNYILDPTSLGRGSAEYIHYYVDNTVAMSQGGAGIGAERVDAQGNPVGENIDLSTSGANTYMPIVKSQLADMIQMSTIVMGSNTETLKTGRYYLTKNGAGVKIEGPVDGDVTVGTRILGGAQLVDGREAPTVRHIYTQSNGRSYTIDRLIEGTTRSVYSFLSKNDRFSEFFNLCNLMDNQLLDFAGISSTANDAGIVESDQYVTFFAPTGREENKQNRCLDYNVKFFSNYNYTLYAPDNDAMQIAYAHGLPTWEQIHELVDPYLQNPNADGAEEAKEQAAVMIKAIRDFIRYHFHANSIYASPADAIDAADYTTFLVDDATFINKTIRVSRADDGKISVSDEYSTKVIDPSNSQLFSNEMTRDMEFAYNRTELNNYVSSSSYAVVHELAEPLSYNSSMDYSRGLESGGSAQ